MPKHLVRFANSSTYDTRCPLPAVFLEAASNAFATDSTFHRWFGLWKYRITQQSPAISASSLRAETRTLPYLESARRVLMHLHEIFTGNIIKEQIRAYIINPVFKTGITVS